MANNEKRGVEISDEIEEQEEIFNGKLQAE
jgi:hypothetical protein